MAERKRVALIYTYSENWIGGTYYIENLIAALGQLPDALRPELTIFSRDVQDATRLQNTLTYPYWSFRLFDRPFSRAERAVSKISRMFLGHPWVRAVPADVDLVFPLLTKWRRHFRRIKRHVYWIADFQEHYLPSFFQADEIASRKEDQQIVVQLGRNIVFSSYAAQEDFNAIYPGSDLAQYVLQFAVTSRTVGFDERSTCLERYGIYRPYFICSNQFWKHKDHPTVLRAVAQLRAQWPQALVVFTGKEHDYRNPTYYEELAALRDELEIHNYVKFLGFIPRIDQLTLMQAAIAVIQPSLFEGWSTVVEDAKSLNVPLIVSAINVHREQLTAYGAKMFFTAGDAADLAHCLNAALLGELPAQSYNYQHDVTRFAQEFMRIVNQISKD